MNNTFFGLVDGSENSLKSFLKNLSPVDQVGAEARAAPLALEALRPPARNGRSKLQSPWLI